MRARFSQILGTVSALAAATATLPVSAADEIFLKIEGVTGDVIDINHKDEINIQSFFLGLSNSGTSHTGSGSGKAIFQDLSVVAQLSKASPVLSYFCATGKPIPSAKLTVRKAGNKPFEYYTVTLANVLVSSLTTGDDLDSNKGPIETYTLNFSKITWTYTPMGADGKPQAPVTKYFDILKNIGG